MTRRAKTEAPPDAPVEPKPPTIPAPLPSEAGTLEDLIDLRFRDLLSLCVEPKDLSNALKEAVTWMKVKKEIQPEEEWGSALGKGTLRDG